MVVVMVAVMVTVMVVAVMVVAVMVVAVMVGSSDGGEVGSAYPVGIFDLFIEFFSFLAPLIMLFISFQMLCRKVSNIFFLFFRHKQLERRKPTTTRFGFINIKTINLESNRSLLLM